MKLGREGSIVLRCSPSLGQSPLLWFDTWHYIAGEAFVNAFHGFPFHPAFFVLQKGAVTVRPGCDFGDIPSLIMSVHVFPALHEMVDDKVTNRT